MLRASAVADVCAWPGGTILIDVSSFENVQMLVECMVLGLHPITRVPLNEHNKATAFRIFCEDLSP